MAKPFNALRDKMSPEARKLAKEKAQSIQDPLRPATKPKSITTEELDKIFDEGKEEVLQYFDMDSATRPNQK